MRFPNYFNFYKKIIFILFILLKKNIIFYVFKHKFIINCLCLNKDYIIFKIM